MLREIISGYSENDTEHITTPRGQNAEFWTLNLMVHVTTTDIVGLMEELGTSRYVGVKVVRT